MSPLSTSRGLIEITNSDHIEVSPSHGAIIFFVIPTFFKRPLLWVSCQVTASDDFFYV